MDSVTLIDFMQLKKNRIMKYQHCSVAVVSYAEEKLNYCDFRG